MFRRILGITLAVGLMGAAWGEGAVTIVGRGNGPVTIIEKDGSVQTVNLPNTAKLEAQGKKHAEARAALKEQEAEQANVEAQAKVEAEKAAEEQRKAAEEARKVQAAREAKALKARTEAAAKEQAHYSDKDYTYGPGSADKVDRTAAVVNTKKAGSATEESGTFPRITVGGETRVRFNNFSR